MAPGPQKAQVSARRLESWKEIAGYLNVSVRTVQRWEEQNQLPVRRVVRSQRSAVFALTDDLDRWVAEREVLPSVEPEPGRRWFWVLLAVILSGIAWMVWLTTRPPKILKAERLTSLPGREVQGQISPDGKWLAFVYGISDGSGIAVRRMGESGERKLTPTDSFYATPQWSPDSSKLVFLRRVDDRTAQLMVWDPLAKPELRTLAEVPGRTWFEFVAMGYPGLQWYPDGQSLLIWGRGQKTQRIERLYLADGRREVIYEKPGQAEVIGGFALSQDGADLVAAIKRGPGHYRLYHLLGNEREVEVPAGELYSPVWVAKNKLAFLFRPKESRSEDNEIWMEQAGNKTFALPIVGPGPSLMLGAGPGGRLIWSNQTLDTSMHLRDVGAGTESAPICDSSSLDRLLRQSHDGRYWAFTSTRGGTLELWACEAKGTAVWQITHEDGAWGVSWAPDSHQIAYTQNDGRRQRVMLTDVRGTTPRVLSLEADETSTAPSWSRDGKSLYYNARQNGKWMMRKLNLASGELQVAAEGKFGTWIEGPDGRILVEEAGNVSLLSLPDMRREGIARNVGTLIGFLDDGKTIAYSRIEGPGLAGNHSLWYWNGKGERRVEGKIPGIMGYGPHYGGLATVVRMSSFEGDLYTAELN